MSEISIPHQIEHLELEIASYEQEIAALKGEVERIQRLTPRPQSNDPSEITKAFTSVAQEVHRRAADLSGLNSAIAHMQQLISDRRQTIVALKAQQAEQQRVERLEAGKAAIRTEMEAINQLSGEIETRIWHLKKLWKEHDALQYSPQDIAAINRGIETRKPLVQFFSAVVPLVQEKRDRFEVGQRIIPLFQEEHNEWKSKLYSY